MSVSFITTKNGVVTGYFNGDINCDLYGQSQYGHERVPIPDDAPPPVTGDPVEFYDKNWRRKSEVTLIDEGLLPMPSGYVRDGDALRKMTPEERVIAGLDEPAPGTKVVRGEIVEMTLSEKVEAGLAEVPPGFRLEDDQFVEMSVPEKFEAGVITEEEFRQFQSEQNQAELSRRLTLLSTKEAKAIAEIDSGYAAQRLAAMKALLAVRQQKGWPYQVEWPPEEAE